MTRFYGGMQTKHIWIKYISYKNVLYWLFQIAHTYLRHNLYSKDTMRWTFLVYGKESGIFMYKYNSNMLPHSFDWLYTEHQSNHSYNTRNKGDYQFHMFRMRTVLNTGPKIWNNLPKYVKYSKSISQFKGNFVSLHNSWSARKWSI